MALRNYTSQIPTPAEFDRLPYRRVESNAHRTYPSSTTIVKNEPSGRQERGASSGQIHYEPPMKRQRIEDSAPGLKFVSQEKWKFSSNQPWIEVNPAVTSKARNAVCIGKQESNEKHPRTAKRPQTSPIPSVPQFAYNIAHKINSPEQISPVVAVTMNPSRPDTFNRSHSNSATSQTQPHIFQRTPSTAQSRTAHAQEAATSQGTLCQQVQDCNARNVQNPSLLPSCQQPDPESSAMQRTPSSYIEVGPTKIIPKTVPAPDKGLSLEKDSDRIAALIAAKRRDNEASMFRQKMLQRQIEHRTHTSSRKLTGSVSKTSNIGDQNVNSNSDVIAIPVNQHARSGRPVSPKPSQRVVVDTAERDARSSEEHDPGGLYTVAQKTSERPKSLQISQHEKGKSSATRHELHTSPGIADLPNRVGDDVTSSHESHPKMQNSTRPDFYGKKVATPARQPSADAARRTVAQASNVNGNSGFNNDRPLSRSHNVDLSASVNGQILLATSQVVSSSSRSSKAPPKFYTGDSSSYIPEPHQQRANVPNPTGRASGCDTSNPSAFRRSSPLLQPHTQPHEFSTLSKLPESSSFPRQFGPQYPHARPPLHSHTTQSISPQVTAPTYYNINQNFFLGSNQIAFSQTTSPKTVRSQSSPIGIVTGDKATVAGSAMSGHNSPHGQSRVQASFHAHMPPRNLPQPPVLVSNMNMFSGEARISAVNSVRPEAVKRERVNMFMSRNGATGSPVGPGMIMAMEDVRRGIEMT